MSLNRSTLSAVFAMKLAWAASCRFFSQLCLALITVAQASCGGGDGGFSSDIPSSAREAAVSTQSTSAKNRAIAPSAADCSWNQGEAHPAETFSVCPALPMEMSNERRGLMAGFDPQDEPSLLQLPLPPLAQMAQLAEETPPAIQVAGSSTAKPADAGASGVPVDGSVTVIAGVDAGKRRAKTTISLKDL